MTRAAVELELALLSPGRDVTIVDLAGTRFAGSVVKRRPEDPERSVGVRRSGGTVHWISYDRVREVE